MFVEAGGLAEALRADDALVRSMLLVHVQDVYAEAIAFLKRARAQMTGKLAIALVHAASVLQMLVAVVLVGEHLPAPLALVALAIC